MLTWTVQTASPVTSVAVDLRWVLASKLPMVIGVPGMVMSLPLFSCSTVRFPSASGTMLLSEDTWLAFSGTPLPTVAPAELAKPRADGPSGFLGCTSARAYSVPVLVWSQAAERWASVASLLNMHLATCSWSGSGKKASDRPGEFWGWVGLPGAKITAPARVPGSLL